MTKNNGARPSQPGSRAFATETANKPTQKTRATGTRGRIVAQRQYFVYVIELRDEAATRVDPRKPCVYVGQTGKSPEERLAEHLRGYRHSRWVRQFGIRLRPRLYTNFNPLSSRPEAEQMERRLAKSLKDRGFTVFGGH